MNGLFVFALACMQASAFDPEKLKFFLYTVQNADSPVELQMGATYGLDLINPAKDVKILCHGYVDTANSFWIAPTKTAYMSKDDMTVIAVDWSKYASGTYSKAYKSAKPVGESIADLVMKLSQDLGIPLSKFHLIGHSLGAHISGFAGKKVLAVTGQKIGRISGLDPAGPSFNGKGPAERLSTDDADFVDAIHTDSVLAGYKKSIGHVDFWPNGGSSQNGCSLLSDCSHCRSTIYFYESINNQNFPAYECGSMSDYNKGKCAQNKKAILGDNCDPNARGNFYLKTNKNSPFGIPA